MSVCLSLPVSVSVCLSLSLSLIWKLVADLCTSRSASSSVTGVCCQLSVAHPAAPPPPPTAPPPPGTLPPFPVHTVQRLPSAPRPSVAPCQLAGGAGSVMLEAGPGLRQLPAAHRGARLRAKRCPWAPGPGPAGAATASLCVRSRPCPAVAFNLSIARPLLSAQGSHRAGTRLRGAVGGLEVLPVPSGLWEGC